MFPAPAADAGPTDHRTVAPGRSPLDTALLTELERLMKVERLYRQEGLTIGALAAKLGLTERQLRRTINVAWDSGTSTSISIAIGWPMPSRHWPIRSQAEVQILTIALDFGFQSLGPFNRAFKTDTGMTPTEFRRSKVGSNGG